MNKKFLLIIILCSVIICGCKNEKQNEQIPNNEVAVESKTTVALTEPAEELTEPVEELTEATSEQEEINIDTTESMEPMVSEKTSQEKSTSVDNKLPDDRDVPDETVEINVSRDDESTVATEDHEEPSESMESETTTPTEQEVPEIQTSLPIENIVPRDD